MVVDDHEFVRGAVVAMLERAPDMMVCAQAAAIADAEQAAAATAPDVVVIDLHLGDASSIEAARRLRNVRPAMQTVMLTAASDRDALMASMLAGAAGYLPKQLRGTDLVGTVRSAAAGERLLDRDAVADVLEELSDRPSAANGSRRPSSGDLGLLALLASGRTDEEIQQALDLDHDTVKLRITRLVVSMTGAERAGAPTAQKRRERDGSAG